MVKLSIILLALKTLVNPRFTEFDIDLANIIWDNSWYKDVPHFINVIGNANLDVGDKVLQHLYLPEANNELWDNIWENIL